MDMSVAEGKDGTPHIYNPAFIHSKGLNLLATISAGV
jgi:hypothetical protein